MRKDLAYWFIGIITLILFWQILTYFFTPYEVAEPLVVFKSIYTNYSLHIENLYQTTFEAFMGIILSCFVGFIIIFFIALFPSFEKIIYPFIVFIKSTPAVAFVPILILLFSKPLPNIFVSSLISFFPLVIGGLDGMKRTPEKFITLSKSYYGSNIETFLNFKFGYSLEGFLTGLKIAAPLSVVGAIVGEYLTGGGSTGLGVFIATNNIKRVPVNLYAGVVLSSLLGITFFLLSNLIYNVYDKRLHIRK
ncbi:MAG: ABC transporter permease subunit [Aequorivita antarctica]